MLFFPLYYYISCSTPLQDTAVDILKRPDDWDEQKQEDNVVEETEQELDRDGDGQDAIEDGGNDCDDFKKGCWYYGEEWPFSGPQYAKLEIAGTLEC